MKLSLLLMAVATVLIAMGLRWREERMGAAGRPKGIVAAGKAKLNRWITAAAIAAVGTSVVLGVLHWARL